MIELRLLPRRHHHSHDGRDLGVRDAAEGLPLDDRLCGREGRRFVEDRLVLGGIQL